MNKSFVLTLSVLFGFFIIAFTWNKELQLLSWIRSAGIIDERQTLANDLSCLWTHTCSPDPSSASSFCIVQLSTSASDGWCLWKKIKGASGKIPSFLDFFLITEGIGRFLIAKITSHFWVGRCHPQSTNHLL
ncbi:hypothetical protein Y1Q_0009843 [Alligator mississippiensis]|uniref:Uncharacterized protein n=1 Tax=Alligator mississippiensis TaxID=8496 RepID=A0A151MWV5_ALLMI|nr:hypothetical protein Y1Q_0009843 [Alligator mississippiensis]